VEEIKAFWDEVVTIAKASPMHVGAIVFVSFVLGGLML
jgi:hypothetical protein